MTSVSILEMAASISLLLLCVKGKKAKACDTLSLQKKG